jgi:hypothetical protein
MNSQPEARSTQQTMPQRGPQQEPTRKPGRGCAQQVRSPGMLHALQLPVCARPAKRVLPGGLAPACVQRAMQKQSKPLSEWFESCAWVAEPAPHPHLLPDPLFGSCLEEVLQKSSRGAQQESETAGSRSVEHPSFTENGSHLSSSNSTGRDAGHKPTTVPQPKLGRPPRPSRSAQSASAPFTHPTQAGLELLTRRAGGYQIVSRLSARQKKSGRPAFPTTSSPRGNPSNQAVFTFPDSNERLTWLAPLSRRLGRRFQQVPLSQKPTGDVGANGIIPDWITHAISVEPAGPYAPLSLLLHLIGEGGSLPEDHPLRNSRPDRQLEMTQTQLLRSQAERTASGVPAWEAPFSSMPRGDAPAPVTQPPTGAKQGFYPQSGSIPLPAAGQPYFRPPLAPPLATEIPPTLLPPQEVFDAPTPFASAETRQSAKRDEARLDEQDLDVLASKIRRILNDEARRHGIQV